MENCNPDFYYDPNGYLVFTEKYHLERGYCCKNGCRHCPWKVDDEKASIPNQKQVNLL